MLDKSISFITKLFLFLLPLYFLPSFGNSNEVDKQMLLLTFSLILFFLFALKIVIDKNLSYKKSPVDFFMLVLALTTAASALLFTHNKAAAFLEPYSAGTILSAVFLFFLLSQSVFSKPPVPSFFNPLLLSSLLVALTTIGLQFGLPKNFTPMGNYFFVLTFLTIMFLFGLIRFLEEARGGNLIKKIAKPAYLLLLIYLVTVIGAITVAAYHTFTDSRPYFLPYQSGWAVMMETFKTIQQFLLGIGPTNFPVAFSFGKPALVNVSPLWNTIPSTSSSFILTLATELGVIAGIAMLLTIISVFKLASNPNHNISKSYLVPLLVSLILQFLFPTNIVLLVVTFVLLAASFPKKEAVKISLPAANFAPYILIMLAIASVYVLYWQVRVYAADLSYRQAIDLLNRQQSFVDETRDNDAKKKNEEIAKANSDHFKSAFTLSQQAINTYPYSERNYLLSSSLSLSFAQNLAQSPAADATESAKQIAAFSQQAVNHAQAAINLNPLNGNIWGQLATIYQSLIGKVEGAENFTVEAYNRQISLDPNSPQPKLQFGNFMMKAGQYDQAQMLLTQAVNLKPDWNMAHYQLATLFNTTKRYKEAAAELQRTLDLTPADSQEYKQVQQQLDEVKKLLPTPQPSQSESPTPSQTPTVSAQTSTPISTR